MQLICEKCGSSWHPRSAEETTGCPVCSRDIHITLMRAQIKGAQSALSIAHVQANAVEKRLREQLATAQENNERFRQFIEEVANFRGRCHSYDKDMSNPLRDFDDEEEWNRIEEWAKSVLTKSLTLHTG